MFTSERPYYSLALFSSFIYTCTTSKKDKFASKRTLDYFPKKYPVYDDNWRRILLTCIQLLLIQVLDVIWSMPTNFAFFKKQLDKFFYKFDNLEINRQEILPASCKNIENREGF